MAESTLTSKGQTTVPLQIRQQLNASAGTRLVWHALPDGVVVVRVKSRSLLDLAGSLRSRKRKRVAVEDMNAWR